MSLLLIILYYIIP